MNELKIFSHENFGEVRTTIINDEIWFVAKDIAKSLGYVDTKDAIKTHCKKANDFRGGEMLPSATPIKIIPEQDVYRLIMRSQLSTAEKFQDWVFEEVLPAIKKTGGYIIEKESESESDLLARALIVAQATLARREERLKNLEIEKNEAIKTKAWISDKKTATAMNTASQKSKEVEKLKEELGRCKECATIVSVNRFYPKMIFKWQELKRYCEAKELEIRTVPDERYGFVNTYPAKAWMEVYSIDLDELF